MPRFSFGLGPDDESARPGPHQHQHQHHEHHQQHEHPHGHHGPHRHPWRRGPESGLGTDPELDDHRDTTPSGFGGWGRRRRMGFMPEDSWDAEPPTPPVPPVPPRPDEFGPGPLGHLARGFAQHFGPDGPGFGPGMHGPGMHGRGPGGPGGRGRGGRGRGRRGDIRAAILRLLAEQPMHGYQLMQEIGDRTQGRWQPSPGAVYPSLSQLEDEGLITTSTEGGRKLATLTDAGRAYLTEQGDRLGNPFADDDATAGVDLREGLAELVVAVRQVERFGTDTQRATARDVLRQARRSLYLALADDEPPAEQ